MNTHLSLEQTVEVFEKYNHAVWPMQVILYLLAIVALYLALKPDRQSSRIIWIILSFFWFWSGIVFCVIYWAPVYTPAFLFGIFLIIQGSLSGIQAFRPGIVFSYKPGILSIIGIVGAFYALIGYPLVGYFAGHGYPRGPVLGAPCPTTIFTFSLLFLSVTRVPWYILVIPFIWALCGFIPVSIGIVEDIGLIILGVVCTVMISYRDAKRVSAADIFH